MNHAPLQNQMQYIIFVLISPIFYLFVKNKYLGIVSIIFLTALSVFEFWKF